MGDMGQRLRAGNCYASLILLLEDDIGRLFIYSDSEALQFRFNNPLIRQRFVHVQDDKDKIACLRNRNHLTSSTLSIFCSLDNTRKVEHLYLCAIIQHLAGDGGQRRELVGGSYIMLAQAPSMCPKKYLIHIPSECCPVNLLIKVLLPTDGKPINPLFVQCQLPSRLHIICFLCFRVTYTLATPVRATSNPAVGFSAVRALSKHGHFRDTYPRLLHRLMTE